MVSEAMWAALVDPHRRALLELLRNREQTVGELAHELGAAQPATSKHLKVLREAGLVLVRADAQRRIYAVNPRGLAELDAWLAPYRQLWHKQLAKLDQYLDQVATGEE